MKKHILWTIAFFLGVWEVFSLLPFKGNLEQTTPAPNYLSGIIHVHSRFSDGGGTVPEIAAAAEAAKMDFVVLTDHNNSQARKEGFEKKYGPVDLFVEMEASTPSGHMISFYSHTAAKDLPDKDVSELTYKHFLGTDTRPGMFAVIAHPSNVKNPWNRFDRYSEGIEVINFDSFWQRQLSDSVLDFFGTIITYPFNAYLSALRFFRVYPKDFSSWDDMNSITKGHFAILAQDTHSKLKINNDFYLPWPSYEQTFKLGSNAVYLPSPPSADFNTRKTQIYESIRAGRLALVFDLIFPFPGNDWHLKCGEKIYRMGDAASYSPNQCKFVVQSPANFPYSRTLRLWKDGELKNEITTHDVATEFPLAEPGNYRLEVWAKPRTVLHLLLNRDVPYIFYNPIYVK